MSSMEYHKLSQGAVRDILRTLATILVRGLSTEQRTNVLKGLSGKILPQIARDEAKTYQALYKIYEDTGSLDFLVELVQRIEATQSFYQDIGTELVKLRYLMQTHKVGLDKALREPPYIFVMLPLKDEFKAVYEQAIRPCLEELGCVVKQAEELSTVDSLIDAILTHIARATFLVADVTGKNPNVYYEIGYAHGKGKKVMLLMQNTENFPFDTQGLRHILYSPRDLATLRQEIRRVANVLLQEHTKTPN